VKNKFKAGRYLLRPSRNFKNFGPDKNDSFNDWEL